MTALIVNPHPLGVPQDVVNSVKAWLAEAQFEAGSDDSFTIKWNKLSDAAKRVVTGLFEEGGYNVKEMAVRHAVMRLFGIQSEPANRDLQEAKQQFTVTDLVKLIHNIHSGDELSVHTTWEFRLRKKIAEWLSEQKSN